MLTRRKICQWLNWHWLLPIYFDFTERGEMLFFVGYFWGLLGLSCANKWWNNSLWSLLGAFWGQSFSVLPKAHPLFPSIIFLSRLTTWCCTTPRLNLELSFQSFLPHAFRRPGDAEIPLPFLVSLPTLALLFSKFGGRKSEEINLIE